MEMTSFTDLLTELIAKTHAVKDRKGEYHINCPECGHPSSPSSPHCSFSARGFYCFVCGAHGGLADLARRLSVSGAPILPAPRPEPKAPPSWMAQAERIVRLQEGRSDVLQKWAAYKALKHETLVLKRLGVGVLPASRCPHERLTVPIIDGTMIVGLRGRALGCDCGKWLAPGGTDISLYPLYNQDALGQGGVVMIVENPIDALMITERFEAVGVATYSVNYWQERWEAALIAANPAAIVVAYDNDLPGNGGAARRNEFLAEWKAGHNNLAPKANGIRLVNRLLSLRLPAQLLDWGRAAHKADIGQMLAGAA